MKILGWIIALILAAVCVVLVIGTENLSLPWVLVAALAVALVAVVAWGAWILAEMVPRF